MSPSQFKLANPFNQIKQCIFVGVSVTEFQSILGVAFNHFPFLEDAYGITERFQWTALGWKSKLIKNLTPDTTSVTFSQYLPYNNALSGIPT